MITILPIKEKETKNRILQGIADAQNNADVLLMSEAGRDIGYVAVDLKSSTVRILKLSILGESAPDEKNTEAIMAVDSLMRAAASYGACFGAYRIESQTDTFQTFFEAAGFRSTRDGFVCDLSNFIKNCKD